MAFVEFKDVSKVYHMGSVEVHAVDGMDFEIEQGELVVIVGPSGAGKTTVLNMLGGMDQPDSGTILVRGQRISGMNDRDLTRYRRQQVSFVFQNFNLIAELTALENVRLTADTAEDPHISEKMLRLVGLEDRINAYPSQLSGGQQQRVSIARALARRPALFLCDEPTGALDSATGKQILVLLEELARQHGKTVVIVTHTREISRIADRTILLRNGKIAREERNGQIVPAREIEW